MPLRRVPPNQQKIAVTVFDAPRQLIAQAVRGIREVLLRLSVGVLKSSFLAFDNLVANDLHDHEHPPLRQTHRLLP